MRRALLDTAPRCCSRSRRPPTRPRVKVVDCAPALDPLDAQRDVRGAHAHGARQRADAGPLHAAGARGRARTAGGGSPPRGSTSGSRRCPACAATPTRRRCRTCPRRRRTGRRALPLARRRTASWSRRSRAHVARCRQPDMRPDLEARRVDIASGARPRDAPLRGHGPQQRARPTPARSTSRSRRATASSSTVAVLGLAAGAQRVVTFTGPPCAPGAPLTVTVDPDGAVDERDEDDNVARRACPG